MKRLDILGAALLLVATLLLVTALEEAGIRFPWKSPFVIILLTVSGLLWIVFLAWERKLTRAASVQEPVFPWRFVQSRVWVGMLLYVEALKIGWLWLSKKAYVLTGMRSFWARRSQSRFFKSRKGPRLSMAHLLLVPGFAYYHLHLPHQLAR